MFAIAELSTRLSSASSASISHQAPSHRLMDDWQQSSCPSTGAIEQESAPLLQATPSASDAPTFVKSCDGECRSSLHQRDEASFLRIACVTAPSATCLDDRRSCEQFDRHYREDAGDAGKLSPPMLVRLSPPVLVCRIVPRSPTTQLVCASASHTA